MGRAVAVGLATPDRATRRAVGGSWIGLTVYADSAARISWSRCVRTFSAVRRALVAATSGGARGMRIGNLGRIETGCLADIILIDPDSLPFTPLNDLRRQLVYSHSGSRSR